MAKIFYVDCSLNVALDRRGLLPRDDVIASDLAFSRERSAAGGDPAKNK